MKVKVRYLSDEIAKSLGSSGKIETIQVAQGSKFKDVMDIFMKRLKHLGRADERLMDTLVFLCRGRALLNMKDETLDSDCEVLVGYADTGG